MRSRVWFLAVLIGAACSDSTSPRLPDDREIPRGEWEILVESISRGGVRSYAALSSNGEHVAPLGGFPADAIRLLPSPDGSTIAWLRATPDDLVHLWVMDRYGAQRRAIVEGEVVVHDMAWSPDGTRLAVELSTLDDANDIWIHEADGGGGTQITFDLPNAALFDQSPSWSPDGSRIAFSSNRSGTTRLWTMRANGTELVQLLTFEGNAEQRPTWSPDGSRIAFVTQGTQGIGIGVVRSDGTDFRAFPIARAIGSIGWTPDGLVLFTSVVDLDYEVLTLNPATGAITRLTTSPAHELRASVLRWREPAAWQGFTPVAQYGLGRTNPPAIDVADLNADGRPDLLVLAPAWGEIRLMLGVGDGTFQPFGSLTAPGDQRVVGVADVSRDGEDDIVLLGASALHVWRGAAVGPGVATVHPFDGDGRGLALSDFDEDGSTDVVAIHERPAGFALLVHASRSFDGELVAVVDHQSSFHDAGRACAGDVTGDGWNDLVVVSGDAGTPVILFRGRADGTFADGVVATTAVTASADALPVCADFDGDRRSDLALLTPGTSGAPARLVVLRSTGTGFGAPTAIAVPGIDIDAGDVDRDGDIDLVVAREPGGAVQFLRNRGDGVFAAPIDITGTGQRHRLALADLDRDGWLDLAIGDGDGLVRIARNRGR